VKSRATSETRASGGLTSVQPEGSTMQERRVSGWGEIA
jgi:hypothetical protein